MFFCRENQRFVLFNLVKLLNVQPWGPPLSDREQNYGQKTAIFGHIWEYLAIDGPSCPIWVEHRLNRVEHCISHMEGPVQPLWTHQKWSLGSQGAPKIGHFWPYLAIFGYRQPNCPIWVEHQLNRVEHCISHMEGPVQPLWTHQKWSLGSQGTPKNGHFWPYLVIFDHRRA